MILGPDGRAIESDLEHAYLTGPILGKLMQESLRMLETYSHIYNRVRLYDANERELFVPEARVGETIALPKPHRFYSLSSPAKALTRSIT